MKRNTFRKMKKGDLVFHTINTMVFLLITFLCAYPFYYVIINTISDNNLVAMGKIIAIPKGIHFENFREVFKIKDLSRAAMVSVLKTGLGTVATLIGTSVLGYAMTKEEYWHKKFWYRYMIIVMYFSAGMIPVYLNMKRLGLLDSFWVYVIPCFVSPYNMVLTKTYMESIPPSLEESALIDGAGYFKRFVHIILPLSKPIIATVAIFSAVGLWNSYMDTILYTTGTKLQTMQSLLYFYLQRADKLLEMLVKDSAGMNVQDMLNMISPQGARYAITTVTMLPVLLVYPFFQKYFQKGLMIGAIKG